MAPTSEIEKLERRYAENPLGLTFASLAEAHRKVGNHARAFEVLELGLAQHPNYVPAHIVRGRCHLDTGTFDEAELAFLRVTELDPENVIGLKCLADLCERGGRYTEATRRLEALLEIDRTNEEAREQLTRVRDLAATVGDAPPPPPKPEPAAEAEPPAPTPAEPPAAAVRPPEPPPLPLPGELEALAQLRPPAPRPDEELADLAVFTPEDLQPEGETEFQLPNDADELTSGGAGRLEDVVLGAEIPDQELPIPDVAAGQGTPPGPDVEAAAVQELPGAELTPEPVVPETSRSVEEDALDAELETIPLPDAEASAPAWAGSVFSAEIPELEPAPGPVPEPAGAEPSPAAAAASEPGAPPADEPIPEMELEVVAALEESVREPEPVGTGEEEEPVAAAAESESDGDGVAPVPEPELVVTESMAEVFLRQGHRELALAVYTQLAQRDPENPRVAAAAERLRAELAPPAAAPPATRRYDAASTGGTSVGGLLRSLLGAQRPEREVPVHPPTFEPPAPAPAPHVDARPADDALSLSAVFGEEPAGATGPAAPPADGEAGEPSFDEFFTSDASAELPTPPQPPAPEQAGAPSPSGEDLERFNAWLRGLKR